MTNHDHLENIVDLSKRQSDLVFGDIKVESYPQKIDIAVRARPVSVRRCVPLVKERLRDYVSTKGNSFPYRLDDVSVNRSRNQNDSMYENLLQIGTIASFCPPFGGFVCLGVIGLMPFAKMWDCAGDRMSSTSYVRVRFDRKMGKMWVPPQITFF